MCGTQKPERAKQKNKQSFLVHDDSSISPYFLRHIHLLSVVPNTADFVRLQTAEVLLNLELLTLLYWFFRIFSGRIQTSNVTVDEMFSSCSNYDAWDQFGRMLTHAWKTTIAAVAIRPIIRTISLAIP